MNIPPEMKKILPVIILNSIILVYVFAEPTERNFPHLFQALLTLLLIQALIFLGMNWRRKP
ncbi:hypothetical protein Dxin01_02180 [Deinococcus xinjiangensis]|uniref:Uncharacterized protein n=1 Tax=Deinococcus xinjiangensis TaxID=457454 RepID=A0ABP9VCI6_9DEIO